MKKFKTIAAIGLSLLSVSGLARADLGANVSVLSEWRYRGVSMTNETLAIQGGIDWYNQSGLFASVWAGNVDFFPTGHPFDDGATVELDLLAGYAGAINEEITYDATLYYYQYPGDEVDQDFAELKLGVNYNGFRVGYEYAPDYINLGLAYQYVYLNYQTDIAEGVGLELHVGSSFGEVFDDPTTLMLDKYMDYSIGVTKRFSDLDLKLAYVDTDISSTYAVDSGQMANQGAVVFSVSKSF
ncbi:TorF family putative porin [uncultured Amphritea sp.]|uniref:TorF family putative porin n=1 Tax=uncultured Amphritea sp. TaxID=981605 RepID=UPI0025D618C6|nr:TorF family putative porin [uncultured Amphritea sp.]